MPRIDGSPNIPVIVMTETSTPSTPATNQVALFFDSTPVMKFKDDAGTVKTVSDTTHTHTAADVVSGTLVHERGGLEADVSAYDGLIKIVSGSTSNIKCNFAASAAPTANDDSGDGYIVGSLWLDTTNDRAYVCLDNTLTAAKWSLLTITNSLTGDTLQMAALRTITNSTDSGTAGEVCFDANYVYVCTASNTWKRAALSTW